MTVALTNHARERVIEFGIGLDVVTDIATHPDVSHTNRKGEVVCTSDTHPQWTVVLGRDGVVITVLRRTQDRWEHSPAVPKLSPAAASVLPRTAAGDAPPVAIPSVRPVRARRRAAPVPHPVRPVAFHVVVDPLVLQRARDLAGDDPRRLVIHADGSVTVLNKPRGTQSPGRNPR